VDVDVYTVDANLLVNLTPRLALGTHKLETYVTLSFFRTVWK
jgi:hypothetical protein